MACVAQNQINPAVEIDRRISVRDGRAANG
jgi:hypothetical protein